MHYLQKGGRQQTFDDASLSTTQIRDQMYKDIDWDNRRTNVDSAKKLAVMQHMDYDGFRQMVLGANLKPVKAGAAMGIYNQH